MDARLAPGHAQASPERRRVNPLNELIHTESLYVQDLGTTIRRVTGAWSAANFPPPELDALFRALEHVFRTNAEFMHELGTIGPNPHSPKGLGTLLMQWIDRMEAPYDAYFRTYRRGFDDWAPVASNAALRAILATLQAESPRSGADAWTLDALFRLPLGRMRFYKRLYARLLKNTQPGRSDFQLLARANERIDHLLALARDREALPPLAAHGPPTAGGTMQRVALSPTQPAAVPHAALSPPAKPAPGRPAPFTLAQPPPGRGAAAGRVPPGTRRRSSSLASGTPPLPTPPLTTPPLTTPPLATPPLPTPPLTAPLPPLEVLPVDLIQERIDSSHTVDVFTLRPKGCRLQINPPTLPFTRELRMTDTPRLRAPGIDIPHARVIILSDLVLIGEQLTPAQYIPGPVSPRDVRLLFPPLAGKFVQALDYGAPHEHALRLVIMQRAELILFMTSAEKKAAYVAATRACAAFAETGRSASVRGARPPQTPGGGSPAHAPPASPPAAPPAAPLPESPAMPGGASFVHSPASGVPLRGMPPLAHSLTGSPLVGSPAQSPTKATFPDAASPRTSEDRGRLLGMAPLGGVPVVGSPRARAPSIPSTPRRVSRSASQPALRTAKLPSETLSEGTRDAEQAWLSDAAHEPVRAATVAPAQRTTYVLCAQMRCKVFLKQSYAQWKALGPGRLRMYHLQPSGENQLVVENEKKKVLLSAIVHTDAVERVGRAGIAVELAEDSHRTGIVYMLHMRSEESAAGLFEQLLDGSQRTTPVVSRSGTALSTRTASPVV